MLLIKLISENYSFEQEFKRCCEQYDKLQMYIAWVGNPASLVPFEYLKKLSEINVVVGVSFCQSNPDGIKSLLDLDPNLRIAKDNKLFHPKIYIFSTLRKSALFIGSSNFTYNGFYENVESNVLAEGTQIEVQSIYSKSQFAAWKSDIFSFVPDSEWFIDYGKKYAIRKNKVREINIKDESSVEDENINNASWLSNYSWEIYIERIKKEIKSRSDDFDGDLNSKLSILNESGLILKLPWRTDYFNSIENRRIMLGKGNYGWLGHIGASGRVQKLFSNGSLTDKTIVVESINSIGKLENPLDWRILEIELKKLVSLGPTVKVWGRLLAIVRPDLFCTVSSNNVRRTLASLLEKPQRFFETIEGYIALQKLIHSSPWYNSLQPKDKIGKQIWMKRAAFLDIVLY